MSDQAGGSSKKRKSRRRRKRSASSRSRSRAHQRSVARNGGSHRHQQQQRSSQPTNALRAVPRAMNGSSMAVDEEKTAVPASERHFLLSSSDEEVEDRDREEEKVPHATSSSSSSGPLSSFLDNGSLLSDDMIMAELHARGLGVNGTGSTHRPRSFQQRLKMKRAKEIPGFYFDYETQKYFRDPTPYDSGVHASVVKVRKEKDAAARDDQIRNVRKRQAQFKNSIFFASM